MKEIELGAICEFINGGAWSDKEYVSSGIPVLKVSNFKPNGFLIDDINYLPLSDTQKYAKNKLLLNDVIIATVGSHPNLQDSAAGRSCVVNSLVEGFYLNQNAVCIRTTDSEILDQRYLGYLAKSREFQHYIQSRGRGAANQMRIAISSIKEYKFYLPKIEIQRRIADILSTYDDLIENNRKQIKLLEEAAQRLYKEWFVDLRFPGYEHTKITDGVPEGWEKSTVAAVSSILRRGISPRYNENGKFVVINQKCIRQTVVSFDESRRQEKLYPEDLNLQDSDTVICSTGAGTLGRVGQIFGNYPDTTLDSHVTLVRAKEGFGKQYLFQSLNSRQTYLMGMGKGSTNQLELSRGTIQDLDIYIPLKKVLNQFEQVAQPIHDKISVISKSILQLQTARDHLLPKLMNGEVEV